MVQNGLVSSTQSGGLLKLKRPQSNETTRPARRTRIHTKYVAISTSCVVRPETEMVSANVQPRRPMPGYATSGRVPRPLPTIPRPVPFREQPRMPHAPRTAASAARSAATRRQGPAQVLAGLHGASFRLNPVGTLDWIPAHSEPNVG